MPPRSRHVPAPMRALDALPPSLSPRRGPNPPLGRPLATMVAVLLANAALVAYVAGDADGVGAGHRPPAAPLAARAVAPAPPAATALPAPVVPPPAVTSPVTQPPAAQSPRTTDPIASPPVARPTAPPRPPASAPHVLAVPMSNIAPSPDFLTTCSSGHYDDSGACVTTVLAAIDNARYIEGLGGMALPSNWAELAPAEQLYVATNLERTVRGLAPLSAMATALDAAAVQDALADTDASDPPAGFPWTSWGSNWAGRIGNPLEALYYWMYDDGAGSSNVTCSAATPADCWGHRRNVLAPLACTPCVMGTGWVTTTAGTTSLSELLVDTRGTPAVDFTWAEESPYLA